MAAEPGKNFTRVIEDLRKNPSSYSVFYAMYLCERLSKQLYPERDDDKFDHKGLKFRPFENYVYPPGNIRSFDYQNEEMSFIITFLGLYGINAPLPRCYHEQVAFQQNVHGPGEVPLQNFLDIFNNRFYWLYYQSWKKYRYYLQLSDDPGNKTMQRVFSFIGLGPHAKKTEVSLPRFKLLQLSGILSTRVRSKAGLLILLNEFFPGIRLHLREFVPSMVRLSEVPRMGRQYGAQAFQLGKNSIVGRTVLDYMSRVCLEIGPLEYEEYLAFLPRGEQAHLLRQLLNLYLSDGLEYDIKFIIKSDSIGKIPWNDQRVKLGLSFWMGKPKEKFVEVYFKYEKFTKTVSA
jgi:type VI secretion system protein ImpH